MKLTYRLTLDALIQALRGRMHDLADSAETRYIPNETSEADDSPELPAKRGGRSQ